MPKRLYLKLWLSILALIAACSPLTENQPQTVQQSEVLSGQLVLWTSTLDNLWTESILTKFKEGVSEAVIEFSDLYDQVEIVIEFIPQDQLVEEFVTQVNRGFGPDLVLTNARNIPVLSQAGVLRDLSDYEIEVASFRSEALEQVHFQGKLYGWPMFLHTQVLCYNKAKVKQLPTTLSELRSQARLGYSVGIVSGFGPTFWGTQIFGGELFDQNGRVILERGQGWAQWMEWLKAAKDDPNFILSADAPALQEAFTEGRLAYTVCYSAWIPAFRKVLGEQKFGVTLLPGAANRPAGPTIEPSVLLFNQASNGNQAYLALKFAQFFTNVAQQRKTVTELQALIPVNNDVDVDSRLFPIQGVLQKQSQTGIALPLNTRQKVQDIFRYADILYEQVIAGEMQPDKAATQLAERFNAELDQP
ncbi:MAG: extracellular solute-binding protein [Cyanothece sp. SIO1E1]|nr:extracellular solute-binding protein [Cyanothece sp. SIO1E1]